jgi:hypothetical protein
MGIPCTISPAGCRDNKLLKWIPEKGKEKVKPVCSLITIGRMASLATLMLYMI